MSRRAVAGFLLALALPASATEGLVWKWEKGQVRRYSLRADVELIDAFEMNQRLNVDANILRFDLSLNVTCTADTALGKAAWSILCDVDDAAMRVLPFPMSAGRMAPIIEEWTTALKNDARIELVLEHGGKVRSIDVDGLDKRLDRFEGIALQIQLAVQRAFAAFDVHLPKGGNDQGVGAWLQNSSWSMLVPSQAGSFGAPQITVGVLAAQPPMVLLSLKGVGTISSHGEVNPGQPRYTLTTELDGSMAFDVAAGELIQVQYVSVGTPTASSVMAETRSNSVYRQNVVVERVADGEPMRSLQPNRELPQPTAPGAPPAP